LVALEVLLRERKPGRRAKKFQEKIAMV